jgi:hypothetical protein
VYKRQAVNRAKYSPGRQFANFLLPKSLEENGFAYKAVSGAVDAAYRVLADPLIVGGKIKKAYDVSKYSLEVIIGSAAKDGVAFNRYFNQGKTIDFWNDYGSKLKAYREATNPLEKVAINKELARLAPEFGDEIVKTFNKSGVEDVLTARAFFDNAKDLETLIKNGGARRRVIAPRMTVGRKARVAALTATNKVFNIDAVGPELINASFFGEEATDAGIIKSIVNGVEQNVEYVGNLKKTQGVGVFRFSTDSISARIDRMKQRFTILPMFKNNEFDVTSADAATSIYRLARLALPQRESRLAAEVFKGIEDTGQRKEFFYGLWDNIANIRGYDATKPTQNIKNIMVGKSKRQYDLAEGPMSDVGAYASDFNNNVYVPNLVDLDRASARSTLGQKLIGIPANDAFLEKMVTGWSFLTLAGPRYAVRNSIEDLMVNLAIGETPWGLVSSRRLTTRVLTGLKQTEGFGLEQLANSPLGAVMRTVNRKESQALAAEIAALDKNIVANKESIKKLNEVIAKSTNPKQIEALQIKIAKIESKQKTDLVKETRVIMAKALTQGRINRFRQSLGMKPLNQEGVDFLTEQIVYGDLENLLSVVSEGGLNFATGASFLTDAVEFTRNHGVRSEQLKLIAPKALYTRAAGRGFENVAIDPTNESSLVTWLLRISYASNDELGSLAVAYLDDEAEAVAQILNALKNNPKLVDDSILKARNISKEEHARMVYDRTRKIFETRKVLPDGTKELNTELLAKVRSLDINTTTLTGNKSGYKVSGQLSLDDLPTDRNLTPNTVVGPTLVPVTNSGNFAASFMENGWRWLGASNARISRQPIAINELLTIRKQMRKSGFEDAWINSYTKGIKPNTKNFTDATELAKRDLARVAEERAIGQVLAYVDNPLIRTQVAFSSRNFARFYRATEDFYRRITRAVRYNPESIAIAALTYEGITHSGFVQEDDQGEPYFIYPGIAPVYNAYQKMLTTVGLGNEFKVPFPVQFGAQVKMLTPSLNPDSLVPTFAGPVAGISVRALESLVNIWSPSAADTITRYTLGKYSVDQPILSSFLPAHINRLYSAMNKDDRDGQYASAHRKAVTYLESAGYSPKAKEDPITGEMIPPSEAELEDYRLRIKNTTLSILGMRFVFGFFAPASPQVQLKSDMAEWMRDSGRANFKQVWNDLRDEYGGDYEGAMKKWVELYPDQIPFTVSESERSTVAKFAYAEESGNFVEQNQELFKKYKQGATFLIPNESGFSWDAYKTMTDMGLRKNLRVDEHLKKVQTAADVQTYYERKNEYETSLERYRSDYERSKLRKEFNQWKDLFFAGHPMVAEYLSKGSQIAIDRINALNDLELMLKDNSARAASPKTFDALKVMLDTYLAYKTQRDRYEAIGTPRDLQRSLKERTIVTMRQLSQYNENTLQAYDSLFGGLLDD